MNLNRFGHGAMLAGAVSAAISVGLSAVAAHLPGQVQSQQAVLQTAIQMQQFHALALILTGLMMLQLGFSRLLVTAAALFAVGTLLFSINIYLRVIGDLALFRPLVPLGGAAYILGWFVLALAVIWRGVDKPS